MPHTAGSTLSSSAGPHKQLHGPTTAPQEVSWSRKIGSSVGMPWVFFGVASYTCLTLAALKAFHNPDALDLLRREVPSHIYERSMCIFITALVLDLLTVLFERQTTKVDYVLLPAFIKGMASTTNVLVRFYTPIVFMTDYGRPVVMQRYLCWMHTTPSILMLLKLLSQSVTPKEVMHVIIADEVMVVTGFLALMVTGWQRVLWAVVTHVAMLPILPYFYRAFKEAASVLRSRSMKRVIWTIFGLNLVLWSLFGITWDLALLQLISVRTEETMYLICDFAAKVLFSSSLMLGSFKGMEARRESAMRVIEESAKAKLIEELKALLEQKERFMSSVSHELRTPLNGIIGISEGMLSGCCGVLPEGVRRQIYIIRTSGARLLALINDVMDAAALRQNKLVLKQEQVVLRHVVDDVLDLTRSLVDQEVALYNNVPPRLLVRGDTGRIVQILNNLLGNAAKFTRRGHIRVSARIVERDRMVAVSVSDTGIGIPKNKLAAIFLPFEQVDMSISRKYGGFGLGLNIVQELVKAHAGEISVESVEGKGSAFIFTLPLAKAPGRDSLEEAQRLAESSATSRRTSVDAPSSATAQGANGAVPGSSAASSGVVVAGATQPATTSALRRRRPLENQTSSKSLLGERVSTPGTGGGGGGRRRVPRDASIGATSATSGGGGGGGVDHWERAGDGVVPYDSVASEPPDSTLLQFRELHYNAAELSALASSRPYADAIRNTGGDDASRPAVDSIHRGSGTAGLRRRVDGQGAAGGAGLGRPGTPTAGDSAKSPLSSAPPRPTHFSLYGRHLLLSVDDDAVNQNVVRSLLSSTGYEVVAVPSGLEALHFIEGCTALPDLILLDCMMPGMDGYETLTRLRAMCPVPHIPVIMVSAQAEEEHVVRGLDLGADDYVTKPFKRNEFIARIRAQLGGNEWGPDGVNAPIPEDEGNSDYDHLGTHDLDHIRRAGTSALSTSDHAETTILCVDDDEVSQVVLQGMLRSQQYRYLKAKSGEEGISLVSGPASGGVPPDLVLLDCSLPDLSGFEVCRRIRALYNKAQVPVIMLSARHNESAIVEGLTCGANDYVTKPFRRGELMARIRMHLRARMPFTSSAEQQADGLGILGPATVFAPVPSAFADNGVSSAANVLTSALGNATLGNAVVPAGGPSAAHFPPHLQQLQQQAAAAAVAGPTAVQSWQDAAVLVAVLADYPGLCRILRPTELATVTSLMQGAFAHLVSTMGLVCVEDGAEVMAALVLPALPPGGGPEPPAGPGLRLAALHRLGRRLLEAAATIAVPGTTSSLQIQVALLLGPVTGSAAGEMAGTAAGAGAVGGAGEHHMAYFGEALSSCLSLARVAPPMVVVAPDDAALQLRDSGATHDLRGPLVVADAAGPYRQAWLVEVHPAAHQFLPPHLRVPQQAQAAAGVAQPGPGVAGGPSCTMTGSPAASLPESMRGAGSAAGSSIPDYALGPHPADALLGSYTGNSPGITSPHTNGLGASAASLAGAMRPGSSSQARVSVQQQQQPGLMAMAMPDVNAFMSGLRPPAAMHLHAHQLQQQQQQLQLPVQYASAAAQYGPTDSLLQGQPSGTSSMAMMARNRSMTFADDINGALGRGTSGGVGGAHYAATHMHMPRSQSHGFNPSDADAPRVSSLLYGPGGAPGDMALLPHMHQQHQQVQRTLAVPMEGSGSLYMPTAQTPITTMPAAAGGDRSSAARPSATSAMMQHPGGAAGMHLMGMLPGAAVQPVPPQLASINTGGHLNGSTAGHHASGGTGSPMSATTAAEHLLLESDISGAEPQIAALRTELSAMRQQLNALRGSMPAPAAAAGSAGGGATSGASGRQAQSSYDALSVSAAGLVVTGGARASDGVAASDALSLSGVGTLVRGGNDSGVVVEAGSSVAGDDASERSAAAAGGVKKKGMGKLRKLLFSGGSSNGSKPGKGSSSGKA